MSYITWNTKAGSIGAVSQSQYYEFALDAVGSDGFPLEYTHISGTMPLGMRVSTLGVVKGVPVIDSTGVNKSLVNTFTIRANSPNGAISDRTFSITVNNFSAIKINPGPANNVLGTFDDAKLLTYQFTAITDNPDPSILTWTVLDGELPTDAITGLPMTVSSSGLLSGHVGRLVDNSAQISGYDNTNEDSFGYDFSPTSKDRAFTFTLQVTDGSSFDIADVRINVVTKGGLTADTTITIVNNTFLHVDADNTYPPVITTVADDLPLLTTGDNFTYKFDAIDPEQDTIEWKTNTPANLAAAGMTISSITGWMTGTTLPQTETQKEFTFNIVAYKRDAPTVESVPLWVTLTVVKDSTNYITWNTPQNLGTLVNGSISEYKIEAVNNSGLALDYELVGGSMPSGFSLLPNGEIIGKSGFEYFSLDNASANITVTSTAGITTGMTVQGPGVASGSTVLGVYGLNTVKIAPATYITEGSQITFADFINDINITTQLTDLSTTTTIDGGKTTFDNTYNFTVKADTVDHSVSDTRTFTLLMNNYNRAPYENIYIRSLLSREQRVKFASIINNANLFPPEMIYRPTDENFGLAKTMSMLFVPGLTVSTLAAFSTSIANNHYNKSVSFGNIKTARATDSNFDVKYEVVYIEITDDKFGDALSIIPSGANPYLYENNSYTTMYPNSYDNMQYRLETGIGYSNRGALPDWMTSRQEDGTELGMVHAIVLAYTLPGYSKLIAYRLQHSGISFSDINFVSDRYYLTAGDAANYNPDTNNFFANPTDTTNKYVKYPQLGVYR